MYNLQREIQLHVDPTQLWAFIATPRNLNQITPPELNFRIISPVPDQMYNGLQIRYEMTIPLFGRWQWLTEISEIVPGKSFVDTQLEGPYRHWRHHHQLKPLGKNSTRMIDRIDYELPLGLIGAMTHNLVVKKQLEAIFAYRGKVLREKFGGNDLLSTA